MKIPFVDLKAQYQSIAPEIDDAIKSILDKTQFIGGQPVSDFENKFGKYLGTKNCITCANGTDAIEIALLALGVGKGDEVIVPAMSWISTASAVHAIGARPVFVDIHPQTYTIDPRAIEQRVSEATRAIIPVHFYGHMADMPAILSIAKDNDLFVLEDAAQAVGSTQNGIKPGQLGDLATFSFYPGKNLGAYGDGGAIVAKEDVLAKNCQVLARLGQRKKHDHVALGRNSRLDGLQAAILSVKLKFLDNWNQARNRIAKMYDERLSELPVKLPEVADGYKSNFHVYAIQVPERDRVVEKLRAAGIQCQIHYPAALVDLQPLKIFANGEYPVARQLAQNGLSLPMYPEMMDEQVNYVTDTLKSII